MNNFADLLNLVAVATRSMLDANGDILASYGLRISASLSVIIMVAFGIRVAFIHSDDFSAWVPKFASLFMVIGIFYSILYYYYNPIPGIGYSFTGAVIGETKTLANYITTNDVEIIMNRMQVTQTSLETPNVTNVPGMFSWIIISGLLFLCECLAFVIIVYGFMAEALMLLVGPIFIPWAIVPKMDFLFWGWLKCFLQFAFYQVVAAAALFVIANVLEPSYAAAPGYLSISAQILSFPLFVVTLAACIYLLLKIPHIVNQLFSGSSGGDFGGWAAGIVARSFR